jgi:ABC-2 type transport system permease protein
VLPARPGPARAATSLAGGFGLAWRLQRPAFTGWAIGLLIAGLSFGTMGDGVQDIVGDSSYSRDVILQGSTDVVDGFYATIVVMLALLTAGFSVSSALRPRSEEDAGRVEPVLATSLPRSVWLAGHVAVTAVGTVAVLAAAGLGLGVSYATVTGDAGAVARLSVPALTFAPAVLVLSGLARLLHGLAPRASVLAWLGVLVAWVVLLFGDVFDMPQWLQDISPFEHLALMPLQDFRLTPFVVLTLVAAALSAAGQLAFRARDIR